MVPVARGDVVDEDEVCGQVLEDLLVARELLRDLAPKRAPLRRELGVDLLDVRQEEAADGQVFLASTVAGASPSDVMADEPAFAFDIAPGSPEFPRKFREESASTPVWLAGEPLRR